MENKYNCDAYDSGYCYRLGKPLTDEEDDKCEDCCCAYNNVSMNIIEFMAFLKENKIKHQKCGDDICVGHTIYQFGYGGDLISIVLPYNPNRR